MFTHLWDTLTFDTIKLPGGLEVALVHACPETYPSNRNPDYVIAAAARTSFDNYLLNKSEQDDTKLIKRLLTDKHTSPFEMATLTFLVKAPVFVTREMLRHRTFRFNEESQRFHQIKDGYFSPSSNPDKFVRLQDQSNKQSSKVAVDAEEHKKITEIFHEIEGKLDEILKLYNSAISAGAARECARFCLPMATWSHMTVQCDLNNLMKFLNLRLEKGAQYEIQLIARAMYSLALAVFPQTMRIYREINVDGKEGMSIDTTGFEYSRNPKGKIQFVNTV